jgi:expansin (peptidoglycan-binding protein)
MATNTGREFGWDDTIEKDSEFTLLPDGDYDYEVIALERGRHAGSDKLPPCNKATVSLRIEGPDGETTIKHNLFLHSTIEGLLCAFFASIGQRKKGERITMNWNTVVGSTGRCKIGTRKWTNDKGEEFISNEVKKFYEKESKQFVAGTF